MDGKKLDELKQWKCENGHVLGVMERARVKGEEFEYHTSKLIIFRTAIDLAAETMTDVDVAGTLYGRMLLGFSWKCSIEGCGCVREWHPDEEAHDWLRKRHGKKVEA